MSKRPLQSDGDLVKEKFNKDRADVVQSSSVLSLVPYARGLYTHYNKQFDR